MHPQRLILLAAIALAVGYLWLRGGFVPLTNALRPTAAEESAAVTPPPGGFATATFAAGCFWSTEKAFDQVPGVVSATSGYTGGTYANPTYAQVSHGGTGHAEAVQVTYDPRLTTYEQLLDVYWHNVDPFTANRQFCDRGDEYRPAIFVHGDEQRRAAEASKAAIQAHFADAIVVKIAPADRFYQAEAYHQDYARKHPIQYRYYRYLCGQDARLDEIWGR